MNDSMPFKTIIWCTTHIFFNHVFPRNFTTSASTFFRLSTHTQHLLHSHSFCMILYDIIHVSHLNTKLHATRTITPSFCCHKSLPHTTQRPTLSSLHLCIHTSFYLLTYIRVSIYSFFVAFTHFLFRLTL